MFAGFTQHGQKRILISESHETGLPSILIIYVAGCYIAGMFGFLVKKAFFDMWDNTGAA